MKIKAFLTILIGTLGWILTEGVAVSSYQDLGSEESRFIRQGPRVVKPGDLGIARQMSDFLFTDVNGISHKLSELSNTKTLVIAMTGTGCPLCLKYAPTLAKIEKQFQNRDVAFVFVNPNDSEKPAKIKDAMKQHQFRGPYVHDRQMNVTQLLQAKSTTEVFVLDKARTLIYRGAVDDQYGFAYALDAPRNNYLCDALEAILNNEIPRVQATTAPGCELFFESDVASLRPKLTYHNRISRILQSNCLECHREGGIGPMPFETYKEVKDYAAMIGSVVNRGVMPPWFAAQTENTDSGHWANDRSLSKLQKDDLLAWIAAGAPEGNPKNAPLPIEYPDGWLIGQPDKVFEFPRAIPVKATGIMPYQYMTVETDLPEDKWVKAIEVRPGQPDVVHHVIVSLRTDEGEFDESDGYWGAYVPGNSTLVYPKGYARFLPKGAKLRFQMHYTTNGTETSDKTKIGLIFSDEPPVHEVKVAGISNKRISIPAGAENHSEVAKLRLPFDVQILSFLPHMHLRGKAARYEVITSESVNVLLDIPRYDFNWQLLYQLSEPLTLNRGDTISFTAWYDNSRNNPANPNPDKVVRWGQQTHDEMHLGYVEYIVPGATPGKPSPNVKRRRISNRGDQGNRNINPTIVMRAFQKLDKNKDGKLKRNEVPRKHQRLFDSLDLNGDKVLTKAEVHNSR